MTGIGIDASSTCTGYSVFKNDKLIDYGKLIPEDGDWRSRVANLSIQLQDIFKKYKPNVVYLEDVPLMGKNGKGKATLVLLGAVQGMIIGICSINNIELHLKSVSTWRSDIHLFDGTEAGKERDAMKVKSIQKANELFGLKLNCSFTKSGKYNSKKSDDDVSDAILIYASTIDKYKQKKKIVGRR